MSVTLDVSFEELPFLEDLPQRAFNSAAYAATQDIQAVAWSIMPFRTGELIKNMKIYINPSGLTISFDRRGGLDNKQIADVIDRGAAPHTIVPRRAKALRLPDGRILKSVEHPGYSGRGYILKMKQAATEIMVRRLIEALQNWRSL